VQDTQAFSQFVYTKTALSSYVQDEEKEGVWGYLLPLSSEYNQTLIMRKRSACSKSSGADSFSEGAATKNGKSFEKAEDVDEEREEEKKDGRSGGYLVGRHPECGKLAEEVRLYYIETNVSRPYHR
jgi:serine/threonine-protein kinase Chk2